MSWLLTHTCRAAIDRSRNTCRGRGVIVTCLSPRGMKAPCSRFRIKLIATGPGCTKRQARRGSRHSEAAKEGCDARYEAMDRPRFGGCVIVLGAWILWAGNLSSIAPDP